METWVIVLMFFSNDGSLPSVTNIPLGISTEKQCEQVAKQWEQLPLAQPNAADYTRAAACLKIGDWKP